MADKTWFTNVKEFITGRRTEDIKGTEFVTMCERLTAQVYLKQLAIHTSINIISNAISTSEFKTFDKGKEVKDLNYYLFNIEPHVNVSSFEHWQEVVHKLVYENDCLIVMVNDMLHVADSYKRTEYALRKNTYTDVVSKGYKFKDTFEESQVFHFKLHNTNIKDIIEGLYTDYGELVEYSKKNYKRANAKRGILDIPTNYPETPKAQEALQNLMGKQLKNYFEAENGAVLPLTNGIKYTDLSNATYKNTSDSRDIRNLIDDVFDFVAIGFQIPPQLLKGTVADSDKSIDNFLMFCIRPIAELITNEVNRKYYGRTAYLNKSYIKLDTSKFKLLSIKDLANSIDLLTRNGVNTLDDNRVLLDREPLNTEESQKRFVTKNYELLDKVINGGE